MFYFWGLRKKKNTITPSSTLRGSAPNPGQKSGVVLLCGVDFLIYLLIVFSILSIIIAVAVVVVSLRRLPGMRGKNRRP